MRTRAFISSFLAIFLLLPAFASGAQLVGKVVRIVDGDTLVLLDSSKTQTKIRLGGIDGPENAPPSEWRGR